MTMASTAKRRRSTWAREEVAALRCPATLQQCDFVNALARWTDPVDFVWVGQWLHHLMAANKLGTMREIRDVLPGRVTLLI